MTRRVGRPHYSRLIKPSKENISKPDLTNPPLCSYFKRSEARSGGPHSKPAQNTKNSDIIRPEAIPRDLRKEAK